ncbi:class A beta-lactamase [Streptomyces venezuelae]|uniref:Beta-lactamase n=2 Tax=Streptomyces venezuelae TaxID=54571 RepID=A0A5P2DD60_STRVZ|nr:class A beta-lactamase [Streptomyces venezuelae]
MVTMAETPGARPSRRAVLALGTGAALAAGLATGGTAHAVGPGADRVTTRLRQFEREHSARLGVYARNLATGRTVAYREDELFPMCSVFKGVAAAAVLRELDEDGEFLAQRIRYTAKYVEDSGYGPETGKDVNLANGMTVEALCAASVSHSDNAAANLLLEELGGPTAVTRFSRSIGDRVTRLDRYEPQLNSAEPGRVTDTTSPRAIGRTYARLILGDVLPARDRRLLTGWLIANTTNTDRFRKGLPADWILADKTGGGQEYGVANDVGVVWTPDGTPLVLAVLTTKPGSPTGPRDSELVRRTAELLAATLV